MNDVEAAIKGLNEIVGEELGSVVFVRDYVQFNFDGPTVTFVADPVVKSNGDERAYPTVGSRDLLCAQIGKKLVRVYAENDKLQLEFEGSSTVYVFTTSVDGDEPEDEVIWLFNFPSDLESAADSPRGTN